MSNSRALQIAGTAVVGLVAAWAGARWYAASHPAVRDAAHSSVVRVPAGVASAPNPSDVDTGAPQTGAGLRQVPDRLPDFALHDRSGTAVPIATWRDKSLVLNFWATWCAPCRREIPLLKTLSAEWAGDGIQVVGVAVDYPDKVAAYIDALHIGYPVLIGEQEALDVAAKLGVENPVFPFTVFTDRRGDVVALYVGELHAAEAALILGEVKTLNQGRTALPEARRIIAERLAETHAASLPSTSSQQPI